MIMSNDVYYYNPIVPFPFPFDTGSFLGIAKKSKDSKPNNITAIITAGKPDEPAISANTRNKPHNSKLSTAHIVPPRIWVSFYHSQSQR